MAQLTIQQAFALAVQHHQAGRLREAEQLYRQILAQQPNHAGAMHYLGVAAFQAGRNDVAVDLIRRAIDLNPSAAGAYSDLGNALRGMGQLDQAIAAYRNAIARNPHLPEAHGNLGIALKDNGQLDQAIAAHRHAIALNPNSPVAHSNLSNALRTMGQLDEAIAAARQAIILAPNLPEAHSNLGNALQDTGQFDEAIAAYRRAIALRPDYAQAHSNLGNALTIKGQLDEAIAACRQATALQPDHAQAHNNLGNALADNGLLDESIAAYRRAITLEPDFAEAHSNLILALHFHPACDSRAIAEELSRWNRQHAQPLAQFIQPPSTRSTSSGQASSGRADSNECNPERRLRIGYVSPDFREHVVARCLLALFQQRDRRQFEIICYAQVPRPDAMTRQLQQSADGWRNIVGRSDDEVARQIREDRIDLLVDLALHTSDNRLLVFARKPAPMSVTYLGYCGSSGMDAMDYRLSDPHMDPPGADLSCYTEKTVYLPRTYWCYQPHPAPTPPPAPAPALKNGHVTFGCLNNFTKVSAAALDLWARILAAVPNSRMILHAPSGKHLDDLAHRMQKSAVAKDRLRFVARKSWTEYAQTYSQIDIALDPIPYGGGITTCDALWMGVPVVSLSGQTAVGRGGRSILSNLGLTELIAFTPDQYAQTAIDLAGDMDRLFGLRQGLRGRMLASPLMDAEGFARDVEAAYRQMWRTWCETAALP